MARFRRRLQEENLFRAWGWSLVATAPLGIKGMLRAQILTLRLLGAGFRGAAAPEEKQILGAIQVGSTLYRLVLGDILSSLGRMKAASTAWYKGLESLSALTTNCCRQDALASLSSAWLLGRISYRSLCDSVEEMSLKSVASLPFSKVDFRDLPSPQVTKISTAMFVGPGQTSSDALARAGEFETVRCRIAPGVLRPPACLPLDPETSVAAYSNAHLATDHSQMLSAIERNDFSLIIFDSPKMPKCSPVPIRKIKSPNFIYPWGGANLGQAAIWDMLLEGHAPIAVTGMDFYLRNETYAEGQLPQWFGYQHRPDGSNQKAFKMCSDLSTHNFVVNNLFIAALAKESFVTLDPDTLQLLSSGHEQWGRTLEEKYGRRGL